MDIIQPTKEWYESISRKNRVSPRCPFANVNRCPRFYFSLSILGEEGVTTKMDKALDDALLAKWKESELYPVVAEQDTGVGRINGKVTTFANFCPEVSFDIFGYFATYFHRYSDEIDIDIAHQHLGKIGASLNDWRWAWQRVEPQHYLSCPYYSLLQNQLNKPKETSETEKILDLKPSFHGISLNVNALIQKVKTWLLKRKGN